MSADFLSIVIDEQLTYCKCFWQFLAATLEQDAKMVSCDQKEYAIMISKATILQL